jgi:16S rRNA (guanine1207-N2)-methyltransferase
MTQEDGVSAVLARAVIERSAGRLLVVDDPAGAISGPSVVRWERYAGGLVPATPFPPPGPFDGAAVRLPKGREGLRMVVAWVAGRLAPDGRLWLCGQNDAGIRSARAALEEAFCEVEDLDARKHCRVYEARGPRPEVIAEPAAWIQRFQDPDFPTGPLSWEAWPGSFAFGRVDGASALLAEVLAQWPLAAPTRVLDLCAGVGLLAAAVRACWPGATLDLLDHDPLALEAAARNLPGARCVLSDGWANVPEASWDFIVSNPPFHQGVRAALDLPAQLLGGAVSRLTQDGLLVAVLPKTIPIQAALAGAEAEVALVAEDPSSRVWVVRRRAPTAAAPPRPAPARRGRRR